MKKLLILLGIIILVFTAACSSEESEEQNHPATEVTGDTREETSSLKELPPFLDAKSEEMQILYQAVAQNQKLLESIPCYCGCGDESIGHKDNYDCFIHENNDDGSLVWDDHATRCQACLDIAAESIIESSNGKSVKVIRNMIEEKYKEGYAEPTPTPEV
ncbi:PCYCGC motif-containing (lipo)protein [Virgibacillus sp. W0181]|uniref:PCYCGC motif-containing (lipo)protein n=1 Tax=Virgibacillus sp. W0181 TaxID=3391581 RepID=UPI003F45604C